MRSINGASNSSATEANATSNARFRAQSKPTVWRPAKADQGNVLHRVEFDPFEFQIEEIRHGLPSARPR